MKTPITLLGAAGLAFAVATSAAASTSDLQQFADRAYAQASRQLDTAHVVLPAPVSVKAYVGGDGRLNGVRVVGSSGSRDTDYAVEQALKSLKVPGTPAALAGQTLRLKFGAAPIVPARTP